MLTADEQYKEAVGKREADLMAGEYAPLRADNFEEAIGESLVDQLGGMPQTIVALLGSEFGPYIIARLLLAVATEYMSRLAALKAENDLLRGVAA